MKSLRVLFLLLVLTVPVFAQGNMEVPGAKPTPEPPACTENCSNSTSTQSAELSTIDLIIIWLLANPA